MKNTIKFFAIILLTVICQSFIFEKSMIYFCVSEETKELIVIIIALLNLLSIIVIDNYITNKRIK